MSGRHGDPRFFRYGPARDCTPHCRPISAGVTLRIGRGERLWTVRSICSDRRAPARSSALLRASCAAPLRRARSTRSATDSYMSRISRRSSLTSPVFVWRAVSPPTSACRSPNGGGRSAINTAECMACRANKQPTRDQAPYPCDVRAIPSDTAAVPVPQRRVLDCLECSVFACHGQQARGCSPPTPGARGSPRATSFPMTAAPAARRCRPVVALRGRRRGPRQRGRGTTRCPCAGHGRRVQRQHRARAEGRSAHLHRMVRRRGAPGAARRSRHNRRLRGRHGGDAHAGQPRDRLLLHGGFVRGPTSSV